MIVLRSALYTGLVLLALLIVPSGPSAAARPRDYDVAGGHYYEQGVRPGMPPNTGYVVQDDEAAPFWGELRRLGGVQTLGYPISNRYACESGTCQAFRHAVFRWDSGATEAQLLNLLDELHLDGHDDWLDRVWDVPPWLPEQTAAAEADGNDLFAILLLNESLRTAYWRLGPKASDVYGVPRAYRASEIRAVLRTQRAVLVQSTASPGQVALLPAGLLFAEAGMVPAKALAPTGAPEPIDAGPPSRISLPDLGIDAAVVVQDMSDDGILPVPASAQAVAWYSYGARPGEGGNAVLAGHVDWNGQRGTFWRLREASPGQLITLYGSTGLAYTYRIDWARDYPAEALATLAALRPTGGPATLTLFTCSGRFDLATRSYESRRVVRATLLS